MWLQASEPAHGKPGIEPLSFVNQLSVESTGHVSPVFAACSSVLQSVPLLTNLNTWEYVLQLPADVLVPKSVQSTATTSCRCANQQVERERAGRKLSKGGRVVGSTPSQAPPFLGSYCLFKTTARLPKAMSSTGGRCWSRNSKANFC